MLGRGGRGLEGGVVVVGCCNHNPLWVAITGMISYQLFIFRYSVNGEGIPFFETIAEGN